jgi:energy-coupling factor transport system permease protein
VIDWGASSAPNSALRRLDIRTRIIGAFLILLVIATSRRPESLILLGVIVVGCMATARIAPGLLLRNIRMFLWLVAATFLLHALLTPGDPLVNLPFGGVATKQGVIRGALFGSRLALMISVATMVSAVTSPMEMGDAVQSLFGPLRKIKLPVDELAMMASIAASFLPVVRMEGERLMRAQLARGAPLDRSFTRLWRGSIALLVPVVLSAFRRADQLALAMEARGYVLGRPRTHLRENRWGMRDGAILVGTVVVTGICIYLEIR